MFAVPVQLVGALLLATCGGSSGTIERISGAVPPVTPPPASLEVEITDLNREYMKAGKLRVELFGRGMAWLE